MDEASIKFRRGTAVLAGQFRQLADDGRFHQERCNALV